MGKLTENEEVIVVEMYQDGSTKKDIGIAIGISDKYVRKILVKYGVDKHAIRYNPYKKNQAMEMALNGASDVEISAETGISIKMAKEYIKRVEKEVEQIEEDQNLIKAIPLEKTRYIVINGTSYTDITDFVAGI